MASSGVSARGPGAAVCALMTSPSSPTPQSCGRRGDLTAWNDRFGPIVAQVATRVRARFGDPDPRRSAAALSAWRHPLRRGSDGYSDSKLDRP